ncbi:MAG: signal transduction protein : sensor, cNMP-binding domain-like protein [Ramlibacter sp.]|jgi:CRP/FNR family cyclic AMP-dependent transcriptional regulator|uniref:Crp/Fnr family transcriptional regulator n=1 Tax=Ramlibacter sp. TaxID=1917967 RepID=UPI002636CF87|nr:cyclic nucleotide-binding domain-containing protein [Ramlibacter sp.]MDB5752094.1 signal transduction protein : sensor, cNMP-binding domain-like protein [Ramlibacter sp.]
MNAPLPIQFDVQGLVQSIARNPGADTFQPALTAKQWELLGSYLQPFAVKTGQVLIEQGAADRTVYLVEAGSLTVHYEDDKKRLRLASVGPGSAVGEGAFFTRLPRTATVQAASVAKIWSLTPIRFTELSNRQAVLAVELAMALGSLVSRRLGNRPKRVAVT